MATTGHGGRRPASWRRLMAVERLSDDSFRSLTPAWAPAGGENSFGGHVYAQAAYAATKTVAAGMYMHDITGHFLLPGQPALPFVYRVRRVRDGGSYALRQVDAYQYPDASIAPSSRLAKLNASATKSPLCFVATLSFKRPEPSTAPSSRTIPFEHQALPREHLCREYADVLRDKSPEDHPLSPVADDTWWEVDTTVARDSFPGLEIRKVDMGAYHGNRGGEAPPGGGGGGGGGERAGAWRQLCFYRIIEHDDDDADDRETDVPPTGNEDERRIHLDACAHLYASDRNSLYLITRALGYSCHPVRMASLSHTVIFHGSSPDHVRMLDNNNDEKETGRKTRKKKKWFVQEAWTTASGDNRGTHESRLWDFEAGRVIASTLQDGMVRVHPRGGAHAHAHRRKEGRLRESQKGVLQPAMEKL